MIEILPSAILEDTGQKAGYHDNVKVFCEENGIRLIRIKLLCGDYTLPTDQHICIDTKDGLHEVYSNLVHDHDRVAAECDRATSLGIKIVFLVEEPGIDSVEDVHKWENPMVVRYNMIKNGQKFGRYMGNKLPSKQPVSSSRLQKMMETFAEHHGCEWRFCRKAQTGAEICRILMGGVSD